jgi:hypothetical protein
MRNHVIGAALLFAAPLLAQQPDSIRARQIADSIALVRELEARRADTTRQPMGPPPLQQPVNPRLLPDISAVGDLVSDLSPEASTQEDGSRFGIREIEIALQAAVDPYFRGDVFLGFSDAEGVHIEQAFMTTTAIRGLELRLGRFLMPVGKQNTTHRHDLHTVEYPWVIQRFLGEEGLKGTGLYASRIFAPLGFYQELLLTAIDRVGEAAEDLVTESPINDDLAHLAFSARLRNYWDLTQAANLEISGSALAGYVEQPFDFGGTPPGPDVNAVARNQQTYGVDLTFRWRPLQQGLYRSFIAQGEFFRQNNARDDDPAFGGPNRDFNGAYGFARWQLTRRWFLAARYDWVEDPELGGETLTAASGYLQWFPSEFSKLTAAFERLMPAASVGVEATNRILLQASFAIGPHKPHPF